jgi:hypothetical protein
MFRLCGLAVRFFIFIFFCSFYSMYSGLDLTIFCANSLNIEKIQFQLMEDTNTFSNVRVINAKRLLLLFVTVNPFYVSSVF